MTGRARIPLIAVLSAWACAPLPRPETAPDAAPAAVGAVTPAASEHVAKERRAEPRKATKPAATPPASLESAGVIASVPDAPEPPAPVGPAEASWDIEVTPYLSHVRVEFYVRRFTGQSRSTIVSWM